MTTTITRGAPVKQATGEPLSSWPGVVDVGALGGGVLLLLLGSTAIDFATRRAS